jgi:hypothetical protein
LIEGAPIGNSREGVCKRLGGELLFQELALGDVAHDEDDFSREACIGVKNPPRAGLDPDDRSIFSAHSDGGGRIVGLPRRVLTGGARVNDGQVLGNDKEVRAFANHLLRRPPQNMQGGRGDIAHDGAHIDPTDYICTMFGEKSKIGIVGIPHQLTYSKLWRVVTYDFG